jgi:hypothetical protein
MFITATCVDPSLNEPYVDTEEPGSLTDSTTGVTVHFTYVHGGFTGTDAAFAFYFPAPSAYKGRFFEATYPTDGIGSENAAPGCTEVGTSDCEVAFAISNGAYVVSSNNDGGEPSPLAAYRTNAAAAKYSRVVAAQLYGANAPTRGYLYGPSGGAYQTVGSSENTDGVWQGFVPMVYGANDAIPNFATVATLAERVLAPVLPQIVDAEAPGGSGNPFTGLTSEQASVLTEVSTLGFPLKAWWEDTVTPGSYTAPDNTVGALEGLLRAIDATYVSDFWSQPGYEGSQPDVQAARVQFDTTVSSVVGSPATGLVLANIPAGDLTNADLDITSGPDSGQTVQIGTVSGDTLTFSPWNNPSVTSQIMPGTSVEIDNSAVLAYEYYQRHQVPTPDEYGFNQYLAPNGQPLEPQRPLDIGPLLASSAAGSTPDGDFHGKMIMLESVDDTSAYAWSADWYAGLAKAQLGTAAFDSSYRLWYMDNAEHGPIQASSSPGVTQDHIVDYWGETEEALLDVDAWVVGNVPPPATTGYTINSLDQVQLAPDAGQRHGVQPVVYLSAAARGNFPGQVVHVGVGEPVALTMVAQAPAGAGSIVKVEWDLQSSGSFVSGPQLRFGSTSVAGQTVSFSQPGTYFPVVRVTAQPNGSPSSPFELVQNLASVRVVVN